MDFVQARDLAYKTYLDFEWNRDPLVGPLCDVVFGRKNCFSTHSCEGHKGKGKHWGNLQVYWESLSLRDRFLLRISSCGFLKIDISRKRCYSSVKNSSCLIVRWWYTDKVEAIEFLIEQFKGA